MNTSTYDWWPYLYGAILFQGIFLGVVLLITRKGNLTTNRYLAAIMFIFSLATAERVVAVAGLYEIWPHLLFASSPFWFILPPLYYFYACSFTGKPIRFSGIQWLHAAPPVLVIIYFIPSYTLSAEMKLVRVYEPELFYNHFETFLYSTLYYAQSLAYLALSILVFKRRASPLQSNKWLMLLYSILTAYISFNGVQSVYYFFTYDHLFQFRQWGIPIYSVVIYSFAYYVFVKPEKVFISSWKLWEQRNGRLPLAEMESIVKRLENLMLIEKLYLDSDLKYSNVAAKLGISVRSLSNALNVHAGQSFNDFINSYRIEEAKYQMLSGKLENETILAVALDSGFSTKSSFNRIFKQHTGLTPTEFIELSKPQDEHRVYAVGFTK